MCRNFGDELDPPAVPIARAASLGPTLPCTVKLGQTSFRRRCKAAPKRLQSIRIECDEKRLHNRGCCEKSRKPRHFSIAPPLFTPCTGHAVSYHRNKGFAHFQRVRFRQLRPLHVAHRALKVDVSLPTSRTTKIQSTTSPRNRPCRRAPRQQSRSLPPGTAKLAEIKDIVDHGVTRKRPQLRHHWRVPQSTLPWIFNDPRDACCRSLRGNSASHLGNTITIVDGAQHPICEARPSHRVLFASRRVHARSC